MKHATKLAALGVLLAGTVIIAPAATAATPAPAAPAAPARAGVPCAFDIAGRVTGDAVRVRKAPSLSSPAIGQIVRLTRVAWCTRSLTNTPGHQWVWATGSGFNGRTQIILTGWIDLAFVRPGR